MIRKIITLGNETLRKISNPIKKFDLRLWLLLRDMAETMYDANGVGLAAPQVGVLRRIVIVEIDDIKYEMINPEIIEYKGTKEYFNEGCLSVPGIHEDVLRYLSVVVKYQDTDFNEHVEEFTGMLAHAAQHEIDHLEGTVFVDRLSAIRKTLIRRKLNDIVSGKVDVSYKMKRVRK